MKMECAGAACLVAIGFTVLGTAPAALATEVDSFTGRFEPMDDALDFLNDLTNEWLIEAAHDANRVSKCDRTALFDAVRHRFRGGGVEALTWSAFELHLDESDAVPSRHVDVEESVYRSLEFWEGAVIAFAGLGPTLVLDGHTIGTDKLGHFFGLGYDYYDKAYNQKEGVDRAYAFGVWTEAQFYGTGTTGVYSFADLAANHRGLQFWESLADDSISAGEPYYECVGGQWMQSRTFDWRDYVDALWDEGINCSGYATQSMRDAVEKEIRALHEQDGKRYTCPVSKKTCADAVADQPFGSYWDVTVSPVCLAAAAELGVEPEQPPSGLRGYDTDLCTWSEFFLDAECNTRGCMCSGGAAGPWPAWLAGLWVLLRRRRRGGQGGPSRGGADDAA